MKVGIDSGGTFTDAVAVTGEGEIRRAKVPSTPDDPARGTMDAFRAVGGRVSDELRHGTTVPTNALLERRGARTALVTNAGFEDVIEIGRQRRPDLYDVNADRAAPLVPRELRFGVGGRLGPHGVEEEPLEASALEERLAAVAPEAVAIALLHAYANPAHERVLAEQLRAKYFVVASHEVAREFREYERTSTAVMNAWLGPATAGYLERLARDPGLPRAPLVMRSSGGLAAATDLAARPADALLSGPAAGALAAAEVAAAAGFPTAVGFDMGGTSTDVVLVRDGRPELRGLTEVGGLPVQAPALAIHTVGAGGGSIARLDAGGALQVGPASAGAVPGPISYGRGGMLPTVTDANVLLGRIEQLAGEPLAREIAWPVGPAPAGDGALHLRSGDTGTAQAILDVVEANMERALREVTVQRGVDPREAAIVAFGGAGGLHAAQLCRSLGARCAIVPPLAGVLSAVGLLAAPVRADRARTAIGPLAGLDPEAFAALGVDAGEAVRWAGEPRITFSLDCRYRGQSHELSIPWEAAADPAVLQERFHAEHERWNGYRSEDSEVQVVTVRAAAEVASDISVQDVLSRVHPGARAGLRKGEVRRGPLLLTEDEASIWVPPDFAVRLDDRGNLVISPGEELA